MKGALMAMENPKRRPIRTERQKKHAREADEGARLLVEKLKPMNRPEAEKHIRENRPSVPVIVGMAFSRQRFAAEHDRTDALTREILNIVKAKPLASTDDVIDALRARAPGAVIEEVKDDGTVEWLNRGELEVTPKSAIAKRVSRARKKLRK